MRTHYSLSMLMVVVAGLAMGLALYLRHAEIRKGHRREIASTNMLRPIVEHYERAIRMNDKKNVRNLKDAGHHARYLAVNLVLAFRYVWHALYQPREYRPGLPTHWDTAKVYLLRSWLSSHSVRDSLLNASLSDRMSKYHANLETYYRELLSRRLAELPPFPAALEVERLILQEAIRRRLGYRTYEMDEEPPHYLDPNSSKRKLPQRRPMVWLNDSF